jgi:hypothetical protein
MVRGYPSLYTHSDHSLQNLIGSPFFCHGSSAGSSGWNPSVFYSLACSAVAATRCVCFFLAFIFFIRLIREVASAKQCNLQPDTGCDSPGRILDHARTLPGSIERNGVVIAVSPGADARIEAKKSSVEATAIVRNTLNRHKFY